MRSMKQAFVLILCSVLVGLFGTSTSAVAQQKTVRECEAEWQAHKADNQAKGITETAYVIQCRSGAPSSSTTPTPPRAASPATASPTTAPTATNPNGANEFAAESQAKAHCPTDTVVWLNLKSKIYHFHGYKDYGTTKKGAYMCEKNATAQGFRAAKNEKHPS